MKKYLYPSNILLPDFSKVDAEKWAVIACDQFTSERDYWDAAYKFVGDAPSALNLILPEIFLNSDIEARLFGIKEKMCEYESELLSEHKNSLIYIERKQSDGRIRHGILGAIDLENYDFSKESNSLIRATEGTVIERIPPRLKIRENANIELPHIMILIDDPDNTVFAPVFEIKESLEAIYDTPLMLGGGHITGKFLPDSMADLINEALANLISEDEMFKKYQSTDLSPLLFAVGDGNHSLATAKTYYENLKAKIGSEAAAKHPARMALVEIVNIHDDALEFEPIYRAVFGADENDLISSFEKYVSECNGQGGEQDFTVLTSKGKKQISAKHGVHSLPVGTLQKFLDSYVKDNPCVTVDYIHGEDSLSELSSKGAVGFLFSGMSKKQLFGSVMRDGPLPRKTFSMGEARDKRYYIEARKIK
jgi:uncharacterized protein (DUF1015 family)